MLTINTEANRKRNQTSFLRTAQQYPTSRKRDKSVHIPYITQIPALLSPTEVHPEREKAATISTEMKEINLFADIIITPLTDSSEKC